MNNYRADEQWSFSWIVPVFGLIGKASFVGFTGLCAAVYIVGAVTGQAIKEALSP
jgi:hypothetical protein